MSSPIPLSRRAVLLAAVCSAVTPAAWGREEPATIIEEVPLGGSTVKVTRYAAPGVGKRATVLVLHGSKGLGGRLPAYEQYARDLAGANIDTLLFTYYQGDEQAAIHTAGSSAKRAIEYARSINSWVSLVRTIGAYARDHERSSGHVGILGLSLGGYVAVAAANQPLFSVLAVLYGGLPTFYNQKITSLPPLLAIHGDKDQAVPLSEGIRLVAKAKELGGTAELLVFRNEGHGFDLDLKNPDAGPARRKAIDFISRWIHHG